jgi:hypothetical protein
VSLHLRVHCCELRGLVLLEATGWRWCSCACRSDAERCASFCCCGYFWLTLPLLAKQTAGSAALSCRLTDQRCLRGRLIKVAEWDHVIAVLIAVLADAAGAKGTPGGSTAATSSGQQDSQGLLARQVHSCCVPAQWSGRRRCTLQRPPLLLFGLLELTSAWPLKARALKPVGMQCNPVTSFNLAVAAAARLQAPFSLSRNGRRLADRLTCLLVAGLTGLWHPHA